MKRMISAVAGAVLLFATTASAQSSITLDNLAEFGGSLAKEGTEIGNWKFSRGIDEMTGEASPRITARSEDGQRGLMLWCDSGGDLAVSYIWGKFLAQRDGVPVLIRFSGDSHADPNVWIGLAHRGAAIPTSSQRQEFTAKAQVSESVMLRASDTDGESITAKFDLTGFQRAFAQLPCSSKAISTSRR